MLNDPAAFTTAVQALLASQKQAIDANSIAGGEHLCFVGSGHGNEEDRFVNMVISSFLQKRYRFVAILYDGYESLHETILSRNVAEKMLADHNRKQCLCCISAANKLAAKKQKQNNENKSNKSENVFLQRFQNLLKPEVVKKKLVEIVSSSSSSPGSSQKQFKHVSSEDKLGKRYTGNKRFTLDDEWDNQDSIEENSEVETGDDDNLNRDDVLLQEWKDQHVLVGFHPCSKVVNQQKIPA